MNKTEEWYWNELLKKLQSNEIIKIAYEPFAIRLADKCTYTPDFYILFPDGHVEFHETKGTWHGRGQDNARTKLKIAAEMHNEFEFKAIMIKNYKIVKIEEF